MFRQAASRLLSGNHRHHRRVMASAKPTFRSISQPTFDKMVKENIDDLGLEPDEALCDAIGTKTLQNVDLSSIVTTTLLGEINHMIQSLDRIKQLHNFDFTDEVIIDQALGLLDILIDLCSVDRFGNSAIATGNGGVELMCSKLSVNDGQSAHVSALNVLAAFLHDIQSAETFRQDEGPKMVVSAS